MSTHIMIGIVEAFIDGQWNLRLRNLEQTRRWYDENQIDTQLDWPEPRVTVSAQALVAQCNPGDLVAYLVRTDPRSNGHIGIRGLDLVVLSPSDGPDSGWLTATV